MARFPKVKLKSIPVFPSTVTDGTGIDVTKTNGIWTITLDVSDFQIANVATDARETTYAVSFGGVTTDNPGGSFSLTPFAGFQGVSADLTSLSELGTFGFVSRIGDADYATRTLTPGTGIGITNGGGIAGNPTIAINDVELLAIAGLTSAADRLPYFTGSGAASLATFTSFGRSLVDDADATAGRVTLGLVIGTNVQAYDAELAALAGLTSAADKGIQFTGAGTASTFDLTTAGKALLDDANATAQRVTLGLVIGTDVQAYDADLAALAANSTAGLWAYTGAGTGAARTLTGTTNRITVTNGDGAGNPTFDISVSYAGQTTIVTLGTITTGTWSATAIAANKGGTGQTTYAVGDLLYADTTSTLAKLADIATGNALISGGVGVAFSWGKIGLTTHISGVLAEANGGTNQSSYATGDTLYASAANTVSKLAGNITTTRKFLRQTGTGSASQAPVWDTLLAADVPTLNQNTSGSAATLTTPRAIDGQNFDGSAAITVIAPGTHAATSKATPVDADEIPLVDSAASNVLKRLTWANLKATLKTYFDTLHGSLATINTWQLAQTFTVAPVFTDAVGTRTALGSGNVDNTSDLNKPYSTLELAAWTAFTPTILVDSGALTTYTASGRYRLIGKTLQISLACSITNHGTAGGGLYFVLPGGNSPKASVGLSGADPASVVVILASAIAANPNVYCLRSGGATPCVDGATIFVGGVIEIT